MKQETVNKTIARIEDAQEDLRMIVKDAFLRMRPRDTVEKKITLAIARTVKDISPNRLKGDIVRSLWNFANRQRVLWDHIPFKAATLALIVLGMEGRWDSVSPELPPMEAMELRGIMYEQTQKGIPMQRFYAEVWKEKVEPIIDRICRENALDPNDFRGRNSLRNLAEMETRYADHLENIERMRRDGVRLVVASSHADCSPRCAPWQGRVYSMDQTSGTTADGRRFVPIEEATDVYYTTKAGRTYKNGLLGFNCRHFVSPFTEGMGIPHVGEEERKREYAITQRQRELERRVRAAKTEAAVYRGLYDKKAKAARHLAQIEYERYKKFSAENGRAFYPMRVKI